MDCFAENHYFGPQTTENRSGTWAAAQCLSRRMGVSNAAASKALGPATEREAVGSIAHEQNVGAVSVLQRINLCHSYLGSAKSSEAGVAVRYGSLRTSPLSLCPHFLFSLWIGDHHLYSAQSRLIVPPQRERVWGMRTKLAKVVFHLLK